MCTLSIQLMPKQNNSLVWHFKNFLKKQLQKISLRIINHQLIKSLLFQRLIY